MKAYCATHGCELVESRCQFCINEQVEAFREFAKTDPHVIWSGPRPVQGRVIVGGVGLGNVVVDYMHEPSYLEYSIPKELEQELSALVEAKIAAFRAACQCYRCQVEREKHEHSRPDKDR